MENQMERNRNLALSGLFLAMGFLLPFLTAQIPEIGQMLLPMHLPVMLCGYFCKWQYGAVIGAATPLLRSFIFTMPPITTAIAMAFELAAYAVSCSLLYTLLPKKKWAVPLSLVLSMLIGRLVWILATAVIYSVQGDVLTMAYIYTAVVVRAVPGIILQLIVVPPTVLALDKYTLKSKVA